MDHDYLEKLKASHATLRLLNADNLPLIVSFLFQMFIKSNRRSIAYSELASRLNDYLFQLRDVYGEEKYPKPARQYLEDWSTSQTSFLRKYYTNLGDEPEFDLTPATEKAIEWLRSLEERQFVGTESRLLTIFQLLKDMVHNAEQNPSARIAELERQKANIEAQIEKLRAGIVEPYDPTRVKERFIQAEETARRLLGDFRQVEHNFRALDRETRERIATSDKAKGQLLDDVFEEHDIIWDSDQGRSFRAFWEFLMSPARQEELHQLLESVYRLEDVNALAPDPFLAQIKFHLLEAGEKVYKTNNTLVEQLRKYLDDQAYLENKRILELIRSIEKRAVEIKSHPPEARHFTGLDDLKPVLELVMCRNLFVPPKSPTISDAPLTEGSADINVSALYGQVYVDEQELLVNIRKALQTQSQISLRQLTEQFPLHKGLAEVVSYLNLAARDSKAVIVEDETDSLYLTTHGGQPKQVCLPRVIFVR
jgi:hypothetical protein